jgi:hypothetical protein
VSDRRHRRALRRAAQDLRLATRPLKGTDHPALSPLRAAASLLETTDATVTDAKRALCGLNLDMRLTGVLSIVNAHAIREGLDPYEGMIPDGDQRERPRVDACATSADMPASGPTM